ncbi:hypothetical protein Tco_0747158 [Tanacetum coccineum]
MTTVYTWEFPPCLEHFQEVSSWKLDLVFPKASSYTEHSSIFLNIESIGQLLCDFESLELVTSRSLASRAANASTTPLSNQCLKLGIGDICGGGCCGW